MHPLTPIRHLAQLNIMQNRRQHYRHEFPPTRPISVKFQSPDGAIVVADLINLSIGGLCVYAPALKANATKKWAVLLPLENNTEPLNVVAERIDMRSSDMSKCGFRFLPDEDAEKMEDQERRIWKFLLDAQRRRRRYL
jgi:c-di-GMP-binding flagellar brake protein YcgR